jgi:YegS/Rv2252/BmrU family lipid kinase
LNSAEQAPDPAAPGKIPDRVIAIVNPTSGRGLGRKAFVQLRELLPRHCEHPELYLSHEPGFARKLLEGLPLEEGTIVIAAGGDGTVHEISEALFGREGVRLGVISVGSGNDVARQLGMPGSVPEDLRAILGGTALPWDAGSIGDFNFINSVGFALSADTCWWSHQTTRLRGAVRYAWGVGRAWWGYHPIMIGLDGTSWSGRRRIAYLEIAVGNRVGGGYRVPARALVDDGLLDVCVLEGIGRWSLLPLAIKARSGNHVGHEHVHYEQLANFRLSVDHPIRIHVDGEIAELPQGEHSVRVRPRALNLIVAPGHPRLDSAEGVS